jgi:hypothetical protein
MLWADPSVEATVQLANLFIDPYAASDPNVAGEYG